MNIAQTRQLLSFLWSKFPNSRSLSVEDKQMTVLAYFDELWQYSLQDALSAARLALKAQPHFVPSAPEIAHYATKTFSVEPFLTKEYFDLQTEMSALAQRIEAEEPAYDEAFKDRIELTKGRIRIFMTQRQCAEVERLTSKIDSFLKLQRAYDHLGERLAVLEQEALTAAADAYDATQMSIANNDFKQIGWIERRQSITGI